MNVLELAIMEKGPDTSYNMLCYGSRYVSCHVMILRRGTDHFRLHSWAGACSRQRNSHGRVSHKLHNGSKFQRIPISRLWYGRAALRGNGKVLGKEANISS